MTATQVNHPQVDSPEAALATWTACLSGAFAALRLQLSTHGTLRQHTPDEAAAEAVKIADLAYAAARDRFPSLPALPEVTDGR